MYKILFLLLAPTISVSQAMEQSQVHASKNLSLKAIAQSVADQVMITDEKNKEAREAVKQRWTDEVRRMYPDETIQDASVEPLLYATPQYHSAYASELSEVLRKNGEAFQAAMRYGQNATDDAKRIIDGKQNDEGMSVFKKYLVEALKLKKIRVIERFYYSGQTKRAFNLTDNEQLAVCNVSSQKISVLDKNKKNVDIAIYRDDKVYGIAYTQEGLAVHKNVGRNDVIFLYDPATGKYIRTLASQDHKNSIQSFCYDKAHDRIIFITKDTIMATGTCPVDFGTVYPFEVIGHYSTLGDDEEHRAKKALLSSMIRRTYHYNPRDDAVVACDKSGNSIAVRSYNALSLYNSIKENGTTSYIQRTIDAPGEGPVAYAHFNKMIAFVVGSLNNSVIKLLDLVTNQVLKSCLMPSRIFSIDYNPDTTLNQFAAAGRDNIYIMNPMCPDQDRKIKSGYSGCSYNFDGTVFAVQVRNPVEMYNDSIQIYQVHDEDIAIPDMIDQALNDPQFVKEYEWIEEKL